MKNIISDFWAREHQFSNDFDKWHAANDLMSDRKPGVISEFWAREHQFSNNFDEWNAANEILKRSGKK